MVSRTSSNGTFRPPRVTEGFGQVWDQRPPRKLVIGSLSAFMHSPHLDGVKAIGVLPLPDHSVTDTIAPPPPQPDHTVIDTSSGRDHPVIDTRPYGHRHKGIRSLTQDHTVIDTNNVFLTSLISKTYGSSEHPQHLLTYLTRTTTKEVVVVYLEERKGHGRRFRHETA